MKIHAMILTGIVSFFLLAAVPPAQANNVTVTNVSLVNADTTNGTIDVEFDVTWDHGFSGTDGNGQTFYDRAWVFVKYWVVGTDTESTGWHHATLTTGGSLTPAGAGMGVFAGKGADQTVRWDYREDGVGDSATVKVTACAIEMVFIPQGQFVYNASGTGGTLYNNYGGGSQTTVSAASHVPTGASTGWPNGYNAFWVARYEVSQGQYSDFLNLLDISNASTRFPNQSAYGHTITYTGGNPYGSRYAASSPDRACNYLSWDDAKAYLSWCGMRPLTEMEFEKAGRGGGTGTSVYPWGDTSPSTTTYTVEGGVHTEYFANYDVTGATGDKPLAVGHYLSGDVTRTNEETGASPYGVTDLGGNVWEHLINCEATTTPEHGDGTIAPPASWPAAASGKGIRGGCWSHGASLLRVSDRDSAGWANTGRVSDVGVRPARTNE